ncbi:hypothetical protein [Nonomuraea sp. NPDC049758]|uniref:hypothetical protein n=1 Tax=Nonomuraea sp. NPDC049758 TaxID=3154360 RepID=UPI00342E9B95
MLLTVHSPAPRALVALAALSVLAVVLQAGPVEAVAAPRLGRSVCPETPMSSGGIPRSREYLTALLKCLDKSWSAHFRRTGRTFRKPVVRYYDEPVCEVCGFA